MAGGARGRVKKQDDPAEGSFTKVFVIILAIAALSVAGYIQLAKNINEKLKKSNSLSSILSPEPKQVGHQSDDETLIVASNLDAGCLEHIIDALIRFGHKLSFSGSIIAQKAKEDLQQLNLIWTHDYPFQAIKNLQPHQRLNHFPGTGFITNKLTLSTTPRLPHILKASRMPLAFNLTKCDITYVI